MVVLLIFGLQGLGGLQGFGLAMAAEETRFATVVDGATVLRQSPGEIRAALGRPVRSRAVAPGDFRLPAGGTSQAYRGQGVQIDVDFAQDRSTMVVIEFSDRGVAPKTFEQALEAVNLEPVRGPDLVTRDSREWHNLRGYFVRVIAAYPALDRIEAIMLSVDPFP
jgi:hypothetical protein